MAPAAITLALSLSACAEDSLTHRDHGVAPPANSTGAMAASRTGQQMTGPLTDILPVSRGGAALIAAHREPALRPPVPTAPAPTPQAALAAAEIQQAVGMSVPVETQADLAAAAASLYRFCHHWPRADDLSVLAALHLITPGNDSSPGCDTVE